MKYYKFLLKCGHVGKGKYMPVEIAASGKDVNEAMEYAIKHKAVKCHNKNDVISYEVVSKEEYKQIKKKVKKDPYFKAQKNDEYYKSIKSHGVYTINKAYRRCRPGEFRHKKEEIYLKSMVKDREYELCY